MPISAVLQGAASLLRCTVVLLEVSVGHSHTILLLSQEIALSSVNLEQAGQTQCCTLTQCMSSCAAAAIQLPKLFQMKKYNVVSQQRNPSFPTTAQFGCILLKYSHHSGFILITEIKSSWNKIIQSESRSLAAVTN